MLDWLEEAVEGLLYISETDAPLEAFCWSDVGLNLEAFLREQEGFETEVPVREQTFKAFFAPLVTWQEWYEEEEREAFEQFVLLKACLERYLSNLRVLRFGEVEQTIFVVGNTFEGGVCGFRTEAVET